MGRARRDMLWEKQFQLAIDPETARLVRADRTPSDAEVCTMCGDYCALKNSKREYRSRSLAKEEVIAELENARARENSLQLGLGQQSTCLEGDLALIPLFLKGRDGIL